MFIRYLGPFSFSLFLSACGGGSSSSSTEQVVLDKYDADTYSPKALSQNGLEGAWLYVMKFDLNYWESDFDSDTSIQFQVEMRTIVNLVETDAGLEIHNPWNWCRLESAISTTASPAERCFSDPSNYAFSENGMLTLDLGHGEFIGSINSENNRIVGQVYSYPNSDTRYIRTEVYSSQGGMIKLSDIPSLPKLNEAPSTWGMIDYSETGTLPLHSFIESTVLIDYIDAGEVVSTEQIYNMRAGFIQEGSLDDPTLPTYSLQRQFGFSEYNQADNLTGYPEGWYFSTFSNQLAGVSGELPGVGLDSFLEFTSMFWGDDIQDQSPLVSISDASEIMASVSATYDTSAQVGGSFIADGDEEITVDVLVDLE